MRIPASILMFATTTPLLWSCDQQQPERDVDPQVGRECFELHRLSLPPGSQYEGFEARGDRVTVKVMDGVKLTTVECPLSPDGTLSRAPDEGD